jgi:hypothetical protein
MEVIDLLLCFCQLVLQVLDLPWTLLVVGQSPLENRWVTHFIDDILLFVSLVNWHFTLRLEHSEQLEVSVASHYDFH